MFIEESDGCCRTVLVISTLHINKSFYLTISIVEKIHLAYVSRKRFSQKSSFLSKFANCITFEVMNQFRSNFHRK